MPIKRLHYFDQQFLVEADFTDEQQYHVEMRRRHTRLLHTYGIAEGLTVRRTGAREVTIDPGAAIDLTGRELVLETAQVLDLSNLTNFPGNAPVFVTIAYHEDLSDPVTATGVTGDTRITEAPRVQAATAAPPTDGSVVRLAQFTKTGGGDVPGNPNDSLDGGVRQSPSAKTAAGAITDVNLATGAVTAAKLAGNAVDASKIVDGSVTLAKLAPNAVDASKIVDLSVGTSEIANSAVTDPKIASGAISEVKLSASLLARINTPAGLASLNGMSGAGNIDVVGDTAITVAAVPTVLTSAVGLPTNGQSPQIRIGESHSALQGNVHGLTLANLVALGAMTQGQCDLRLRKTIVTTFTANDLNGKQQPLQVDFPPRIVLATSICSGTMAVSTTAPRTVGGGSFGFFDVTGSPNQRCFGFGLTFNSHADWFLRANAPSAGVCSASFFDAFVAPARAEDLVVTVAPAGNVLNLTLTRTIIGTNTVALPVFQLTISLLIMGT